MLIKNIYPAIAGALKSFCVSGEVYLQSLSKKFSSISNLLNTKNGKRAGTTAVAHINSPFDTECIYFVGFATNTAMHKTADKDKTELKFLTFCIFIFIIGGRAL